MLKARQAARAAQLLQLLRQRLQQRLNPLVDQGASDNWVQGYWSTWLAC